MAAPQTEFIGRVSQRSLASSEFCSYRISCNSYGLRPPFRGFDWPLGDAARLRDVVQLLAFCDLLSWSSGISRLSFQLDSTSLDGQHELFLLPDPRGHTSGCQNDLSVPLASGRQLPRFLLGSSGTRNARDYYNLNHFVLVDRK